MYCDAFVAADASLEFMLNLCFGYLGFLLFKLLLFIVV